MTRINCVPPEELTRAHLIAEYRELPRIFGLAAKAAQRGECPNHRHNPPKYVLGTGHVRFFYSRLGWLKRRHEMLVDEMIRRGYKPSYPDTPPGPPCRTWWGDWTPTAEALAINRARIAERLNGAETPRGSRG